MNGSKAKRGTHGLRKRCPVCKKLRKFTEPADGAYAGGHAGIDHPRRKPWKKVGGRWVCGWCAGTKPGTVPRDCQDSPAWRREHLGEDNTSIMPCTCEACILKRALFATTVKLVRNLFLLSMLSYAEEIEKADKVIEQKDQKK